MGYTHYFGQTKTASQESWDAYCAKVNTYLTHIVQDQNIILQPDMESDHPHFVVDSQRICFNGDERQDLDHETFYLNRVRSSFNFCKTARKPYDLAVCGCLILAHRYLPGVFEISSDGRSPDWQEALDCVQELFKDIYEIPPGVSR